LEDVERDRVEPEPVAGRVPPLRGRQRRVTGDSVLDARQYLDGSDDSRGNERRGEDAQPEMRTPSRTRIALNPSLHVIFFPSAYVRP
jgi:hypothetical protein